MISAGTRAKDKCQLPVKVNICQLHIHINVILLPIPYTAYCVILWLCISPPLGLLARDFVLNK